MPCKVAVLTGFADFRPGFSLTGIVKDQCRMLLEYGHEVHLFVQERYDDAFSQDIPAGVILHKVVPTFAQVDYDDLRRISTEHKKIAKDFSDVLARDLAGFEVAFTHDFFLTGWYAVFGLACQYATLRLPNLRWFDWIHSIPKRRDNWWRADQLGSRHKIIYANKTDAVRAAEAFWSDLSCIRVIPHIKDLRTWYDFDDLTCRIIREYPGIMQADVVQVYPASADRLSTKGIEPIIRIFAGLKRMGLSVMLYVLDQWATTTRHREDAGKYVELAKSLGLTEQEVVFNSSLEGGKYGIGLLKRNVRELQLCSNLFVFPTHCELFGLAAPEAALGGAFLVLNRSLYMQGEIFEHAPLSFDFGSYHAGFAPADNDWDSYCRALANVIAARMRDNESVITRTIVRQKYNYDALYNLTYAPMMEESKTW